MSNEKDTTEEASLVSVFYRETEEQVSLAESILIRLEKNPSDRESQKTLFRALHSIKGNAACVGRGDLEEFIHQLESVLQPLREGERLLDASLAGPLFQVLYAVRDSALAQKPLPPAATIESFRQLLAKAPLAGGAGNPVPYHVTLQYPGEPLPELLDPPYLFQDMADVGRIESARLDPASIPPLESLGDPNALALRYQIELSSPKSIDEVRAGFFIFDDSIGVTVEPASRVEEAAASSESPVEEGHGGTVRINASRLDDLLNLTGELAVKNSQLRSLVLQNAPPEELLEILDELDQRAQELQDQVFGTRMISIDSLFRPFVRVVRELSAGLGKKVHFVTSGSEVALDKAIIEHMRRPMTHLIRNAIDHGIEHPDERAAAGKPPEGTIEIHAGQREGSLYLDIRDDGRGIDRARLRERAIAAGVIEAGRSLSDQETDRLIFETGLSTAAKVTNLSGRGVGMDVVRKTIEELRGDVQVASAPGRGTSFHICLPLTLAIIDGFLAGVGSEVFVFPMSCMAECLELGAGERREAEKNGFINLRGAAVPYVNLGEWFGLPGSEGPRRNAVVVQREGARVAFSVDGLLGEARTVIKPLGPLFQGLAGISGSTILGDGRVALIVDVPNLFRAIRLRPENPKGDQASGVNTASFETSPANSL
ncbi:MAG: chemotaxis protein CheA [Bdellovibrionota bacterium]